MDEANMGFHGAGPIPWSRALKLMEAGAARAYWLATGRLGP